MRTTGSRRGSARTVAGSDLYDRSLGVGDPTSANKSAGKARATWASVDLTGGGSTLGTVREVDVPHDLGEVPTLCTLETYERSGGPVTLAATESRRNNWSPSHTHMNVTLLAGSFEGAVARFKVSGR